MGVFENCRIPKGIGMIIGIAIGISLFSFVGIVLDNLPLGIACLFSGFAIGLAIEDPFG